MHFIPGKVIKLSLKRFRSWKMHTNNYFVSGVPNTTIQLMDYNVSLYYHGIINRTLFSE